MDNKRITTAILVAKPLEAAAAATIFDEGTLKNHRTENGLLCAIGDIQTVRGNIGQAILAITGMGNINSAIATTKLLTSFPNLKQIVLVGIAGVIQTAEQNLTEQWIKREDVALLGDVLVSTDFVFSHDHGKETDTGFKFKGERIGQLDETIRYVLWPDRDKAFSRYHPEYFTRGLLYEHQRASKLLEGIHVVDWMGIPYVLEGKDWARPTVEDPLLAKVPNKKLDSYIYPGQDKPTRSVCHEAYVASGLQVVAGAEKRGKIIQTFKGLFKGTKRHGGLFFTPPYYEHDNQPVKFKLLTEMEAAGIAGTINYDTYNAREKREAYFQTPVDIDNREVSPPKEVSLTVIKGVSDYCDGEKNDHWQRYAALQAAGLTRILLRNAGEVFFEI